MSSVSPISIITESRASKHRWKQYLHGQDGYRYIEHNRAGQEIVLYRGQERAPRNGYQVHLTVDLNLQNIVENEIDAAMREYSPKKATIILMRPQTGEILAMANRPNFDLNLRSRSQTGADEEPRHHRHDGAGLDLQDRDRRRRAQRTQGPARFDHLLRERRLELWRHALHDHRPFGDLSVQDILVKSSNIGAAKLALSVGDQKFYEYIRRFGFGERTGIELPGEISGMVRPPQSGARFRSRAFRWATKSALRRCR